jgi:adenine deaminase
MNTEAILDTKRQGEPGVDPLARCIEVSRTGQGGTLLLRNGHVVNVFSAEVIQADVLVLDDQIVSVGQEYAGADRVLDCTGQVILPGLIDGHIHIESSLLHPAELARLLVEHGTTAIVADPHEITNVLGVPGFEFMLRATEDLPLDVFLVVPSCVPATAMETSGASLGAAEIEHLLARPRVLGLAEMMNYPGVISVAPDVLAKLRAAAGRPIDGHAPGLGGSALQAYVVAGIGSDHECTTPVEAQEKLRAGMRIMIREGSAARNLAALLPIVTAANARRCCLVTDDKHPAELVREGHLDATLRQAVALGLDPVTVVQMVTLNPAEYFGLRGRGAVAPGYQADLTVVDDLEQFRVRQVVKSGRVVREDGQPVATLPMRRDPVVLETVNVAPLDLNDLAIPRRAGTARVIRLVPDQIVTETWHVEPKAEGNLVVADTERDILKLAVIERHRRTGNIGLGLVAGFGLQQGALASSVAHDSHNIIVVGTDDRDMLVAIRRLVESRGGFVAVAGGQVAAELALPVAGLMSLAPAAEVIDQLAELNRVACSWGVRLADPWAALSFLALPVIPELKLTDQGLVDVNRFEVVSLWDEGGNS